MPLVIKDRDREVQAMELIAGILDDGCLCNAQRWRIARWVLDRWHPPVLADEDR